jgi:ribokinase
MRGLAKIRSLRVSVLPDFYFDRIISVPSLNQFFKRLKGKAVSGGGNLRGFSQMEIKGGNATNLAFALASLSVRTNLYCVGDELAHAVLSKHPPTCKVRIIPGRPAYTVALEFPFKGKPVNVMVSDVGDLSNFDGHQLNHTYVSSLRRSHCVALVNWSSNRKGNELAKKVFNRTGRPRLNFLDPADLEGAEGRVNALVNEIVGEGLVDVLSLNENETRIMARILSAGNLPQAYDSQDILRVSGQLHDRLGIAVDVHTPLGSATSTNQGQSWEAASGKVRGFITGAGDFWDAGDIVGHLLGFEPRRRLRIANACAHLHLRGGNTTLPTLRNVTAFLDT